MHEKDFCLLWFFWSLCGAFGFGKGAVVEKVGYVVACVEGGVHVLTKTRVCEREEISERIINKKEKSRAYGYIFELHVRHELLYMDRGVYVVRKVVVALVEPSLRRFLLCGRGEGMNFDDVAFVLPIGSESRGSQPSKLIIAERKTDMEISRRFIGTVHGGDIADGNVLHMGLAQRRMLSQLVLQPIPSPMRDAFETEDAASGLTEMEDKVVAVVRRGFASMGRVFVWREYGRLGVKTGCDVEDGLVRCGETDGGDMDETGAVERDRFREVRVEVGSGWEGLVGVYDHGLWWGIDDEGMVVEGLRCEP